MIKRRRIRQFCLGLILCFCSQNIVMAQGRLPAFPGAEGAGAYSVGGRGGQVYIVTNLNNSGPGSFKEAVTSSGPRIVVFAVGGTIDLGTNSLRIENPYLTVNGLSAPGGGITIKGAPVEIKTHNVIFRYIRFRVGDEGYGQELPDDTDSLSIRYSDIDELDRVPHDIIIDHCSLSWAIDGNLDIWNSRFADNPEDKIRNVTIQWNIISEALSNAGHSKGEHSKGFLLGKGVENISVHHNLFAHNRNRNPAVQGGTLEYINNIRHQGSMTIGGATLAAEKEYINFIGNLSTRHDGGMLTIMPYQVVLDRDHFIYVEDNLGNYRPDESSDDWLVVTDAWGFDSDGADRKYQTLVAHNITGVPVTIESSAQARTNIIIHGGASVNRDNVDKRIITQLQNQSGGFIDSPNDVGGYPYLALGTPLLDTDNDGMPDSWESAKGLNVNVDDSAGDRDGDGYTNIEEYLNSLDSFDDPVIDEELFWQIISQWSNDSNNAEIDRDGNGKVNAIDAIRLL
jgi:pectate lyase